MPRLRKLGLLAGWLLPSATYAPAHQAAAGDAVGSLVSVSLEVEGRPAPLYPAPDGSARFYLEARSGRRYGIRLANNSHERLGVVVIVDGLNAITGEREGVGRRGGHPGRMYVLDPWNVVQVWGWRTSLDEVRRFTFVDERRSYAARAGKANPRMGWIEVAVHRESRPYQYGYRPLDPWPRHDPEAGASREAPDTAPSAPADEDHAVAKERPYPSHPPRDSYPGTGWGTPVHDPVMVVDFHPQPYPAERFTLRYEYAAALIALGIDLRPWWWRRDRLYERDRGEWGFAEPPRWK